MKDDLRQRLRAAAKVADTIDQRYDNAPLFEWSELMEEAADALDEVEDDAIVNATPCTAVIHHGPGHQSRTECEARGPHTEHYAALFGEHTGQYEWTSDIASADYYGRSREVVKCPKDGVLRDPGDTSPCPGYICEQERKS